MNDKTLALLPLFSQPHHTIISHAPLPSTTTLVLSGLSQSVQQQAMVSPSMVCKHLRSCNSATEHQQHCHNGTCHCSPRRPHRIQLAISGVWPMCCYSCLHHHLHAPITFPPLHFTVSRLCPRVCMTMDSITPLLSNDARVLAWAL